MHKRSILKYIENYVKSDNYVKSKISRSILKYIGNYVKSDNYVDIGKYENIKSDSK